MQSKLEDILAMIDQAKQIVTKISNNDLSAKIETTKVPEFKDLFNSLEKMRVNLSNVISEISSDSGSLLNSAEELNSLSEKVQKTSKNMNKKAEQVAKATNEMTDNMNSVSAAAEELSTNMSTVANNANESAQNINSVAAATEEMTATISEIANNADKAKSIVDSAVESVQNATHKIEELNKATKEINAVTSSIAGISEQTKLLALNATIEAARAGQAGVRFAVVASEVKALAVETNQATSEIRNKVNAMLNAAEATINEISSIHKVINQVNEIVANIAISVDMQSDTTKEIASSITHAAHGIVEVTTAVNEANFAVREVAKNITEAASLANDVAGAINEVSHDSIQLKDDSTLLYVGAMEVNSRGTDLNSMVSMIKLHPEYKSHTQPSKVLFKFSEPFKVEVKDLDNQHIGIFDYINRIHAALKQNKGHGELLRIVTEMRNFTAKHFKDEEVLMKKVNYADLDKQIKAHNNLIAKVDQIINQFNSNQDVNMIEVMVFLKDWLVGHIMGMDKKYSPAMHEKNIY